MSGYVDVLQVQSLYMPGPVLSNSNAAHFSLFTHRLNAISYQQQNRNDVCLGNCLLSWTVVPRLRPEDWII